MAFNVFSSQAMLNAALDYCDDHERVQCDFSDMAECRGFVNKFFEGKQAEVGWWGLQWRSIAPADQKAHIGAFLADNFDREVKSAVSKVDPNTQRVFVARLRGIFNEGLAAAVEALIKAL